MFWVRCEKAFQKPALSSGVHNYDKLAAGGNSFEKTLFLHQKTSCVWVDLNHQIASFNDSNKFPQDCMQKIYPFAINLESGFWSFSYDWLLQITIPCTSRF